MKMFKPAYFPSKKIDCKKQKRFHEIFAGKKRKERNSMTSSNFCRKEKAKVESMFSRNFCSKIIESRSIKQ